MQRHYISNVIGRDKLKKFTEKITTLITKEFPNLDPRIFHFNDLYVIKETITNIDSELYIANEKLTINFNLNFLKINSIPSNQLDIVLELYVEPYDYMLGYEFTLPLLILYQKFSKIIKEAQKYCIDKK